MRHFNIPVFIPELACPFRCVFCNQHCISGQIHAPSATEVNEIIDTHLATLPAKDCRIEVAFFGGSFTGLHMEQQAEYLHLVQPFLQSKRVQGVRISTRPDFISAPILQQLKMLGVTAIELGAQSLNDQVLLQSGRGHNAESIIMASEMILNSGFELGLQMMIGLPGDTIDYSVQTARKIVSLGAHTTRIYPCLVIQGTDLELLYQNQKYTPLTLEEAVDQTAYLYDIFEKGNVKILRMGIHPSETLSEGGLVTGPFHPAFGQMVLTRVWKSKLASILDQKKSIGFAIGIQVHPSQLNSVIGYQAQNRKWLEQKFKKVKFTADNTLLKNQYHVDIN